MNTSLLRRKPFFKEAFTEEKGETPTEGVSCMFALEGFSESWCLEVGAGEFDTNQQSNRTSPCSCVINGGEGLLKCPRHGPYLLLRPHR